ncbi:hypothetical protein ABN028_19435 [Actinopolymorpha sp. B17G11]|uniref:hypothetical protein n=1 Tax=Actinopolymorpha sp. B17G11 TaxID=3160861 RepID=UPI0032E46403
MIYDAETAPVYGADVYIFTVTGPAEWLNANDRRNRFAENRLVQQWQEAAAWAVKAARVPRIEGHVHITAYIIVPDRLKRDPANWQNTAKAVVDGIRDRHRFHKVGKKRHRYFVRGTIAEDDYTHVTGPDMRYRIEPGVKTPKLEVHITRREP